MATLEVRESFLCNYLQPVQEDPGKNLTTNREKRNATIVCKGFSIAFLEEGDNNGVLKAFRKLLALPHSQEEIKQAALQRKATVMDQFSCLELHKSWWLTHPGLGWMR